MVLRFWQDLPPSLVLEAVDQIFDRAKDADAKRADEGQQNIPCWYFSEQRHAGA